MDEVSAESAKMVHSTDAIKLRMEEQRRMYSGITSIVRSRRDV